MTQKDLLGEDVGYVYRGNKCPMCSGAAKIVRIGKFEYQCYRCHKNFTLRKESDFKTIQFAQKKLSRERRKEH